ncbi:MAG: DNA polymerase III subunit delta' [candidate division KSB1 bacterium]|nr:DNA polymerase III subunit delta' [candidate division KSB1 bacterium]
MGFERVIGQQHAKDILRQALQSGRLAHAYLFIGPEGVGKEALAMEFAKALLCTGREDPPCLQCLNCRRVEQLQHPDLMFLFPAAKEADPDQLRKVLDSFAAQPYRRQRLSAVTISIERIREVRRWAALKPLEGRQVVVIGEADRIKAEAANALLKLLEEPPAELYFLLTSSQPEALLPTIVSRCQQIRLHPLSEKEIETALIEREGMDEERARLLSRISQGSYRRALEWADEDFGRLRDDVLDLLRASLRTHKARLETVEKLAQQYERRELADLLALVMIWFRDAQLLQLFAGDAERFVVNLDRLEQLKRFVDAFETIDYDRIFEYIETSIQMIERSVYQQLVLLVLLSRMRAAVKLKGRSI